MLEDGTELPVELYGGGSDELGPVAGGLLRCVKMPAGEHTLVMAFAPPSYATGRTLSLICSLLLLLSLLATAVLAIRERV